MNEVGGSVVWIIDADTGLLNSKLVASRAAVGGVATSTGKAERSISGSFRKMVVAAAAVTAAVLVIKRGLEQTVGVAIDYELAFTGVTKTNEGLRDEFGDLNQAGRDLRQELKDLSTEVAGGFSDIAGIAELGGQLGVASDQLVEFSRNVANIAVSTNLTREAAATSFAQIANVIGISSDELGEFSSRFGSTIVGLGNNFATTEADITNFTQRIAGAGSIVGLSADQIAGISTAFTSVGVQAEAGGTAVQKVLLGLSEAAVVGGDELSSFAEIFGLTNEQTREFILADPGAAFQQFVEGLGSAGQDAQLILQDLGLEDQRLVRSFLSVSNAGDLLDRTLRKGESAYEENIALTKEAAQFNQTWSERLSNFGDRLKNVGDTLGGGILSGLESLVGFFKESPVVEQFIDILRSSFLPVIETIGNNFRDDILPAIERLLPTLQLIGQIIAVAVVFSLKQFTFFMNLSINTTSFFINILSRAIAVVRNIGAAIINFVRGAVSRLTSGVDSMGDAVRVGLGAILFLFGGLPAKILGILVAFPGQIFDTGVNIVKSLGSGLASAAGAVFEGIKTAAAEIGKFFAGAGRWLFDAGKAIIGGLVDGIKNAGGAVKDAVSGVLSSARDLLPFSPAKEGPFSGKGWTLFSGMSISDALAEGITANAPRVQESVQGLTEDASLRLGDTGNFVSPTNEVAVQPQSPGVTVNLQMDGVMTRSRSDQRDVARDMIESVNEELRAKGFDEIGNGNLQGAVS